MNKSVYPGLESSQENGSLTPIVGSASALPNRLLTAFEVAEYIGCHEETVRRAYLRGMLHIPALRRPRPTLPPRRRARLDPARRTDSNFIADKEPLM